MDSRTGRDRPPRIERVASRVLVRFGGEVIVETADVVRVLETSHPPVYYLPMASFVGGALRDTEGSSYCEFKGFARYFDVRGGGVTAPRAAWNYPQPSAGYEALTGRVAVYAGPMDACEVDGELVTPQPGGFYGGWITSAIAGPFKGTPGSAGW